MPLFKFIHVQVKELASFNVALIRQKDQSWLVLASTMPTGVYPAIVFRVPLYSSTSCVATLVFGLVYFTVLKRGWDTEYYFHQP